MSEEPNAKEVIESAVQDATPTGCVATFSWDGITLRVVMARGGFNTNFEIPLTEEDCGDTDALTAMIYEPMFDAGQAVGRLVAADREWKMKNGSVIAPSPDTHAVFSAIGPSCSKCGSPEIKTRFVAAKGDKPESLKKTCGGCGYTWSTATLDQAQA
jgi:DNA-directed RNA polymerase subunit M/transcription elongation factor TFIIS